MKLRILLTSLLAAIALSISAADKKPNILLIIADDLNDWIGPMAGHPQTKTPNLDKFAARGLKFNNAQISAPICNPSRASFMTGRRPSTTGIYNNMQPAMPHIPRGIAINDYLRQFGYTSLGAGKIYHYRQFLTNHWDEVVFHSDDTLPNHPATRTSPPFGYRMFTEGEPTEPFNEKRAESELVDYKSASWCIDKLNESRTNAFFMVYGIHRPHTPWDVPKKYFDMHPLQSIQLPKTQTDDLTDVPAAGVKFANPNGQHANVVKTGVWKDRVRAYLASISYMDAQVGRMLDALEKSKHRDNTIVIFVSDHGWHLGEKEHWAKQALWRQATRVPLIWHAPGLTKAGAQCDRGVDLTSLFPTLCELAGVPIPKHAEGVSIKPLLSNPGAEWKQPAITTHLKGNHAITTDQWRYIRYADGTEELYDQKNDPNEWKNLATRPDLKKVKDDLSAFLPKINAEPVAERAEAPPRRANRRAAARRAAAATAATSPAAATTSTKELFNGKDLTGWKITEFGGEGEITIKDGAIIANMGASLTGIQYTNNVPTNHYTISLDAMKIDGGDFFCALTFPVGTNHCSLIVGGWGGGVVGLSNIDSLDASENETTKFVTFGKNKWYKIKVEVQPERILAWLDDDKLIDQELSGHSVSLRPGPIELQVPLGLATYQTSAAWRNIQITPHVPRKR